MKLEILEDSRNYAVTVVRLPPKQAVPGLDKLVKVTVFGNDVLTGKDSDEAELYLFFPAESQLSEEYLSHNNEFRHKEKNKDQGKTGFFEDNARVKAIKFKGVISTGYIAPVSSLPDELSIARSILKPGDEFNVINGFLLCKKYKVTRTQSTNTESRFNKKLKRFSKLVPNQFRFHETTSQLAKNLHMFNPEDIIVITSKWHGTSAIFSNVLIKKELTILEKIARFFGVDVVDKKYDNLYSSRTVIKNQYINKEVTPGYYNEDIWGIVNKELEGKIEQGISIYGEIVGFLSSGKMIQKGYDYGCDPGLVGKLENEGELRSTNFDLAQHKLVVYRITYTKPDGNLIEFSWQQVKDYCKKYNLETVKEIWFDKINMLSSIINYQNPEVSLKAWQDNLLNILAAYYLEKDCQFCKNKVPAEGIVVRIDGRESYSAYKLKSKRFLEKETKDLDVAEKTGEVNIEDEEAQNNLTEQIRSAAL